MRKPATVKAVLASLNSYLNEGSTKDLATLPIKCRARQDGRSLAYILNKNLFDMDTFHEVYEAYVKEYPFHRDELQKAFHEAL